MTTTRYRDLAVYATLTVAVVVTVSWARVVSQQEVITSDTSVSLPDLTILPTGALTVEAPVTALGPKLRVDSGGRLAVGPKPAPWVVRVNATPRGVQGDSTFLVDITEGRHRVLGTRYRVALAGPSGQWARGAWTTTAPTRQRVPVPPAWQTVHAYVEVPGDQSGRPEASIWRFDIGIYQVGDQP